MDAARRNRGHPGISHSRHVTGSRSMHSEDVVRVRHRISIPLRSLRNAGRKPTGRLWVYPSCRPGRRDVTEKPSGYSSEGRWRDSSDTDRSWLKVPRPTMVVWLASLVSRPPPAQGLLCVPKTLFELMT